ncbi:MAG TPA: sensor histidine kinase [Allosphingosinicella sp.]
MAAEGRDAAGRKRPRLAAGGLVWLVYLILYFVPWLFERPGLEAVAGSAIGLGLFLIVYLDAAFAARRSVLPHIAAITLIGFALSPFSAMWSVVNVFAAALAAAKIRRRRTAIATLIGLQAILVVGGLALRLPPVGWLCGIFFGTMAGLGSLVQADLERKNRQLLAAQEEVRALAASAERERIARDLHDLLGHTLTLVAVKAELASRLAARDPGAARREMEGVAEAARSGLAEVRIAVAGMKGASLAVEIGRAKRMLAAAGLEADIGEPVPKSDPEREAVMAMALREAVTNVIRHAGASRCTIEVATDAEEALQLRVSDNGRGGDIREGSGLQGMRARLSAAGGMLELESDGSGTRLVARLAKFAS